MALLREGQGLQCLKYSVFAFNLIFLVLGLIVLAIGVWMAVDQTFLSSIIGTGGFDYTIAGYVLLAGACIIIIIAFMGCFGALRERQWMLVTYFVILLIIFCVLLVAAVLGVVFRTRLANFMKTTMNDTLLFRYGNETDQSIINRDITVAWDHAQTKLECCAVEDQGWTVYQESMWFKWNISGGRPFSHNADMVFVPPSCCVVSRETLVYYNLEHCMKDQFGPPRVKRGKNNMDLHYQGCYTVGYNLIADNMWLIFAMGIGVGLIMITGMVCSMCLCRKIRQRDKELEELQGHQQAQPPTVKT